MTNPPSLQELADEIGLSLKKLKEGFKQLYGSTVYQFVLDHKMNFARQLLGSGSHNVNEVALQLGYSNSSHFISTRGILDWNCPLLVPLVMVLLHSLFGLHAGTKGILKSKNYVSSIPWRTHRSVGIRTRHNLALTG